MEAPKRGDSGWALSNNFVSRDELRHSLEQYSRDPFADLLTEMLSARPTPERMTAWAREKPGEWVNALKVLALLSGYTEKTESIQTHKHLHLHKLSDAELLTETQRMIDADPSLLLELKKLDKADRESVHTIEHSSIPNSQDKQ